MKGLCWCPVLIATVLACSGASEEDPTTQEPVVVPAGCDHFLRAGKDDFEDVQTTLIDVVDGKTVCFSGEFEIGEGTLSMDRKAQVTLRGVGEGQGAGAGATFDFQDKVGPTGLKLTNLEGITLENFTVKNTLGDGIEVRASRNVIIRKMRVTWERGQHQDNGAYGFYPVESTNVLVEDSEASYTRDAGIYVGQSENIVLRRNVAFGNVSGAQVENSKTAEVYENDCHDNALGILVHQLPFVKRKDAGTVLVRDNRVTQNNAPNLSLPGGIVATIPSGTGILVLALDNVEIRGNLVKDNKSTGLLIASYETVVLLGAGASDNPDYDPFPETVYVHDNMFEHNGYKPDGVFQAPELESLPDTLEDIVWDGDVDENKDQTSGSLRLCVKENGKATFRNIDVSGFFANQTTDLSPHDCTLPSVAPVTLPLD